MSFYLRFRNLLLILMLHCTFSLVCGQNIREQPMRWRSSQAVSLGNQEITALPSTFAINSNGTIVWDQKNGKRTTTFEVNAVRGEWTNIQNEGEIAYDVKAGNVTGTLEFSKKDEQLFILMKLTSNGKPDLQYSFTVDGFELL